MPSQGPGAEFLDAAVWHGSLDRADAILKDHPEIAGSDIHTAALLGDYETVVRLLQSDPGGAVAKGGPRDWDPLTYLCFSKYLRLDPSRTPAFVRTATALLDAGADPQTGFNDPQHQPEATWESVLYGAAGVAHNPELTKLLLDRGADPNDGEVPYHAPETLDNRALKILVESGKLTADSIALMLIRKFNWHDDEGVAWLLAHGAEANYLSRWGARPLHFALQNGVPLAHFQWLVDHGADPSLPEKHGVTPFALAARMARADVFELFERSGFTSALEGDDAFFAACTRADESSARRLMTAGPGLVQRLQSQNTGLLCDFAGAGNTAALRLMLELGFDISSARSQPKWSKGETALHVVVARGFLDSTRLLIEHGAPLEARNGQNRTPLGVAFRCLEEQSEWTPNQYTISIARLLIEAGADVSNAQMTLTAGVCLGRTDEATRLVATASLEDRQKALAAAAYYGLVEAIHRSVALGADPTAYNCGLHPDATPLHNAVCSGSLSAVRALVDLGASTDVADKANQSTPLAWAQYFARQTEGRTGKQDAEIVTYLQALQSPGRL